MLTVVKVNNKNTGTMLYCIYFEHTQQINLIFVVVKFEYVFVSWAQDKIHKTT